MTRDLRRGEYLLGLDGLALLRLYHRRDATAADDCIAEMRAVLDRLDDPALDRPLRGTHLDVRSGYARWADVYDRPGNSLVAAEEEVVRPLLDAIHGDPIVDAACGTGRHLAYLTERGHRVIGIDVSPEMLARAQAKVPAADLRPGDLAALPIESGEAGGLVCALAVEHVDDVTLVFAEFARVVAPGGTVIVSDLHPTMSAMVGWGAWFVDEEGRGDVVTHRHSIGDYLNAAVDAGLVLRRCLEPPLRLDLLSQASFPETPVGGAIALDGVPVLLILEFARP